MLQMVNDRLVYVLVVQGRSGDAVGKLLVESSWERAAVAVLHEAINAYSVVFPGAMLERNVERLVGRGVGFWLLRRGLGWLLWMVLDWMGRWCLGILGFGVSCMLLSAVHEIIDVSTAYHRLFIYHTIRYKLVMIAGPTNNPNQKNKFPSIGRPFITLVLLRLARGTCISCMANK